MSWLSPPEGQALNPRRGKASGRRKSWKYKRECDKPHFRYGAMAEAMNSAVLI